MSRVTLYHTASSSPTLSTGQGVCFPCGSLRSLLLSEAWRTQLQQLVTRWIPVLHGPSPCLIRFDAKTMQYGMFIATTYEGCITKVTFWAILPGGDSLCVTFVSTKYPWRHYNATMQFARVVRKLPFASRGQIRKTTNGSYRSLGVLYITAPSTLQTQTRFSSSRDTLESAFSLSMVGE